VTPRETYTALTLARDSVGRKGNHTSRWKKITNGRRRII
jgi:hypothetical protein